MARKVFQEVFPEREVVMVPTREVILGGGNIHCITQQQPKGVKASSVCFIKQSRARVRKCSAEGSQRSACGAVYPRRASPSS